MKRLSVLASVAVAFPLLLAACGSGGTTLKVTATDTGYDSKTYTLPAGAAVTLKLTNNGAVAHEFAILKLGEHVSPPFDEDDEAKIFWELEGVEPGKTESGTFTAPTEPGQYDVVCGIPGHIDLGMTATLIVQ
jgi:uncharacterized cupredoxin-like copper-binding protein